MNKRIRTKLIKLGCKCIHRVDDSWLVTDDPYPIYAYDDYCKLGCFDNSSMSEKSSPPKCESCKNFRCAYLENRSAKKLEQEYRIQDRRYRGRSNSDEDFFIL